MKHTRLRRAHLITAAGILGLLAPLALSASAGASVTVTAHFVLADDPNVVSDAAFLGNGATIAQPHVLLFVALNYTPGGVCGCVTVTKPLGVYYDTARHEWAVFTEDTSSMPSAPSFNVLVVPRSSKAVFVQRASAKNVHGSSTFLSSPLLNGKPKASIQVTQVYNPGGTLNGTLNQNAIGVRYFPRQRQWAILNLDGAKMPVGAAFNVMVGSAPSNGGRTALASETKADRKNGPLVVSNALTNNNPNNVMFVTANLSPDGKGRPGDPHPLVVTYPIPGSGAFRETINNSDFTSPPLNSSFNLLIFSS